MLSGINLNEKDYEQFIAEAIAQLPLYSKEWTNYNASDPGITILENFSAFAALQQSEMNEIPEKVRFKLLALAGFFPEKGKPAKAYLLPADKTASHRKRLPAGQKIYAQDICFEFLENHGFANSNIDKIYAEFEGEYHDYSGLLHEYGIYGGVDIFGKKPKGGEQLYLLLKDLPENGEKAIFYIDIKQEFQRNPFEQDACNPFAKLEWNILTEEGWNVLSVEDGTNQFLMSGYVKITLPADKKSIKWAEEAQAYVVRATLKNASYDIVPKINTVAGLLTEVIQRDTKSVSLTGQQGNVILVEHSLLEHGYMELYVRERDGNYYRYYQQKDMESYQQKRIYQETVCGPCRRELSFADSVTQINPAPDVLVLCREEAVMPYLCMGRLEGYDEQEMELPPFQRVYTENVSVLIVEHEKDGGESTHMVRPESTKEDEVRYFVSEEKNKIIIEDCGRYEGAEVRLGDYSLYLGDGGNVLPGTEFTITADTDRQTFFNFPGGDKGCYEETFEKVRKRFSEDIRKPATIVTQEDCETLVRNIPGLSIHKSKAIALPENNEIHVVIKPNSLERQPKLSKIYRKTVQDYLEQHRMLTTKIVIEQPLYVPIHVQGVIYIKKHFEHCRERIEQILNQSLDGVSTDKNFGETIFFHQIYHEMERLECVDEICELSIRSGNLNASSMRGLDIQMNQNSLFYPGEYLLELSTK